MAILWQDCSNPGRLGKFFCIPPKCTWYAFLKVYTNFAKKNQLHLCIHHCGFQKTRTHHKRRLPWSPIPRTPRCQAVPRPPRGGGLSQGPRQYQMDRGKAALRVSGRRSHRVAGWLRSRLLVFHLAGEQLLQRGWEPAPFRSPASPFPSGRRQRIPAPWVLLPQESPPCASRGSFPQISSKHLNSKPIFHIQFPSPKRALGERDADV